MIRESGKKMEQVTSSLCANMASLGKKNNEEIMPPGGPSKRTRLSSQKKAAKAIWGSGSSIVDITQNTIDVGKEIVKLIKEL